MNCMSCDFSVIRQLRKQADLNIADLSRKSEISVSVISKLERNQSTAELDTLYRIAKVFGLTLTDLIAAAEKRTTQVSEAKRYLSGDFHFERVSFGNARCMHSQVKRGSTVSKPDLHRDDFEICWVISGSLKITFPDESHVLTDGQALQFDALLPHTYHALADSEIYIVHIRKGGRF